MQQRYLGQSKTPVSALGLGCMGMSEFYGASDDAQSLKTLAHALALGVNFFDTADTYGFGHNESLLGRLVQQIPGARSRMVIATKFGIVREPGKYERRIDNTPAYVQSPCDASLKRLGVEAIDLYYCHRRNPDVPIEDTVGAMAALVAAGKVRQIGLSEVSSQTLRKANAVHPIAAVQSEYSLWARKPEADMLVTCADLGTSFVAYSPLGRAFLTEEVNAAELSAGDFRKNLPRFKDAAAVANAALVASLSKFSSGKGVTNAQVALAWLLHKHPYVVPIPGTRQIKYLERNAAAASCVLTEQEMAQLDAMFAPDAAAGRRYPDAGWVGIE